MSNSIRTATHREEASLKPSTAIDSRMATKGAVEAPALVSAINPDEQSDFGSIPTWMWALVFVLVALLLLTYAFIVVSKLTLRARKRPSKRGDGDDAAKKRVTISRRTPCSSEVAAEEEDSIVLRRYDVYPSYTDCHSSATVNSHMIALYPGFYKCDRGCQTDDVVVVHSTGGEGDRMAGAGNRPRGYEDDYEDDVTDEDDGQFSQHAVASSRNTLDSTDSDRDMVSQLTATGLYGKAGEPTKLPSRTPVFPGFRIIERAKKKEQLPPASPVTRGVMYSVKEEDGVVFHEIDFVDGQRQPPQPAPPPNQGGGTGGRKKMSESETGSLFTGASYSDVFCDFESRTGNYPDGASNAGGSVGDVTALSPITNREWYESSSQDISRNCSRTNSGAAAASAGGAKSMDLFPLKKKYVEIAC
eukprot:m.3901 g.3901  ORF g.3901 m.3901 type:complete len:416 (+) comp9952_c0_seq1:108-1355(+)